MTKLDSYWQVTSMNILSLFDGMSGCQIALKEMGINYTYFASEVDKYAIKTTQHNFPNTIQLGDVRTIDLESLPKIDLLIGGSPCQGFSFAGKQLNFNDERSKLFFEFVRILKAIKPKYFLLENVVMKKQYQDIISQHLEIEPIQINSALVSAQNRERLYWTNINAEVFDLFGNKKSMIKQPHNQGLVLKDILESGFDINPIQNSKKVICNINPSGKGMNSNIYNINTKSPTLTTNKGEGIKICIQVGSAADIKGIDQLKRIYSVEGKAPTLTTMQGGHQEPKISVDSEKKLYRKLTVRECARLQTVPDNYIFPVSNSQAYKMLGNGFTVNVIKHILSHIEELNIINVA